MSKKKRNLNKRIAAYLLIFAMLVKLLPSDAFVANAAKNDGNLITNGDFETPGTASTNPVNVNAGSVESALFGTELKASGGTAGTDGSVTFEYVTVEGYDGQNTHAMQISRTDGETNTARKNVIVTASSNDMKAAHSAFKLSVRLKAVDVTDDNFKIDIRYQTTVKNPAVDTTDRAVNTYFVQGKAAKDLTEWTEFSVVIPKEDAEYVKNGFKVNMYVYGMTDGSLLVDDLKLVAVEACTLSFNTDGGSTIDDLVDAAGAVIDLSTYQPTKDGYDFAGWYSDAELTTPITSNSVTLNADTTVYAKWTAEAPKFTLTFETNGGDPITAMTENAGTVIDLNNYVPVKSGFDFAGWYSDATLATPITSVTLTANTTVYAKWTAEVVDLITNGDFESTTTTDTVNVAAGSGASSLFDTGLAASGGTAGTDGSVTFEYVTVEGYDGQNTHAMQISRTDGETNTARKNVIVTASSNDMKAAHSAFKLSVRLKAVDVTDDNFKIDIRYQTTVKNPAVDTTDRAVNTYFVQGKAAKDLTEWTEFSVVIPKEDAEYVKNGFKVNMYVYGMTDGSLLVDDLKLVAVEACTLSFNTDGGSTIDDLVDAAGAVIDLSTYQPTKDGYDFAGWYSDATLTEAITSNSVTLTADTTVYAKWTAVVAEYTLTFETNGGDPITAVTEDAGTVIDLNNYVPVKSGFDFAGWYSDATLATPITSVTLTADTTVYAKWTAVVAEYTLTFETNGGDPITAVTEDAGTVIDLNNYVPVKSGFDFAGWYSDATLATPITSVTLTANTTVYAKWTTVVVDLITNGDFESTTTTDTVNVAAGSGASSLFDTGLAASGGTAGTDGSVTFEYVTVEGYDGQNTHAMQISRTDGETNTARKNVIVTASSNDMKAAHSAFKLSVRLKAVDVTDDNFKIDIRYQTTVKNPAVDTTDRAVNTYFVQGKAAKDLTEWTEFSVVIPKEEAEYVKNGFKVNMYVYGMTDGSLLVDDLKLVPVTPCTLSFNTDGGSTIDDVVDAAGAVIDLSTYQPTKDGYDFAGWYSDATLTEAITSNSVTLAANTTVYAKWTAEASKFTLTFETNGGDALAAVADKAGTVINLADYVAEWTGYEFAGWYSDATLATPITSVTLTADTTVYAKWTVISADLIVNGDFENDLAGATSVTVPGGSAVTGSAVKGLLGTNISVSGGDAGTNLTFEQVPVLGHDGATTNALKIYSTDGANARKDIYVDIPEDSLGATAYKVTVWVKAVNVSNGPAFKLESFKYRNLGTKFTDVDNQNVIVESDVMGTTFTEWTQFSTVIPADRISEVKDWLRVQLTFRGFSGAAYLLMDDLKMVPVIPYTLSFNTDGGNDITAVVDEAGAVIDLSTYVPTKTGYAFAGWYSDEELTTKVTSVTLAANTTVYAKWTAEASKFTLTFETNGGDALAAVADKAGTVINLADYVAEWTGYEFAGWYSDATLTTKITSVTLTADTTVYAKWALNAVNLITNGNFENDLAGATSVTVPGGSAVTGSAVKGLLGTNISVSGGDAGTNLTFEQVPVLGHDGATTNALKIYSTDGASARKDLYVDLPKASLGATAYKVTVWVKAVNVSNGSAFKLESFKYRNLGTKFTDIDNQNVIIAEQIMGTMLTEWTQFSTVIPADRISEVKGSLRVQLTFRGFSGDTYLLMDDLKLIPIIPYTVSFNTNGGSTIDALVDEAGAVINLKNYRPEKSGFDFAGWYSDEELTTAITSVTLNTNTTVYAKWVVEGSGGGIITPDTGDNAKLSLYAWLMCISLVGIAGTVVVSRKKRV